MLTLILNLKVKKNFVFSLYLHCMIVTVKHGCRIFSSKPKHSTKHYVFYFFLFFLRCSTCKYSIRNIIHVQAPSVCIYIFIHFFKNINYFWIRKREKVEAQVHVWKQRSKSIDPSGVLRINPWCFKVLNFQEFLSVPLYRFYNNLWD